MEKRNEDKQEGPEKKKEKESNQGGQIMNRTIV
jgi:hypothetical protein